MKQTSATYIKISYPHIHTVSLTSQPLFLMLIARKRVIELTVESSNKSKTTAMVRALIIFALFVLAVWNSIQLQYPLQRAIDAIGFPYQLDAEEGFMLGQANRLARGESLYGSLNEVPYLVDNYPPLYPMMWAAVGHGEANLAPGRTLVFAFSLLAALSIALLVMRSSGIRIDHLQKQNTVSYYYYFLLAAICSTSFLTTYACIRWVGYARVDFPALGLSLIGLALFGIWATMSDSASSTKRKVFFAAAVLMMALATLVKQTALVAPATCFLWLLARHQKNALRFMIAIGSAITGPHCVLWLLTGGRYWAHTITYNHNKMYWNKLISWSDHLWRFYPALLIAVVLLVITIAFIALRYCFDKSKNVPAEKKKENAILELSCIYFALALISLLSLAKAGSAENYLLEPWAALFIFIGTALGHILDRLRTTANIALSIVTICVVLLLGWQARFQPIQPGYNVAAFAQITAPQPRASALVVGDKLVRYIKGLAPGPILSEDPIYFQRAGRPIIFQHFIMTQLAQEKKWNEKPMLDAIEQKIFPLIIAHKNLFVEDQFFNRYSPAIRQAIRKHYQLNATIPRPSLQTIYLYRPLAEGTAEGNEGQQ